MANYKSSRISIMLIIYAHPNKNGHCGYMLKTMVEKLERQKIQYHLLDLYQMNYDPVLKPEELYSAQERQISPENASIQNMIREENGLIFIYPTWWNSVPAVLKGFVDRVFTSKFAFHYKNGKPYPLLTGKKAAVLCSSGGPSFLWFNRNAVNFMTRDVLKFCGIKSKAFVVDKAIKLDEEQKRRIDFAVEQACTYLTK